MQSVHGRSGVVYLLAALLTAPPMRSGEPVRARHGMVVAQEPLAADVGVEILKQGGNAIDAAIAVGFALAVTHPVAGNIGGGGFMLVRLANGRTAFLDFRECAPRRASRDMYLDSEGNPTKDSIFGWRSSGVPGSVAGFETAYQKFGSKPWANLVQPAILLARDGFPVSKSFSDSLHSAQEMLSADPESKRIFLRGGNLYREGEIFRQPELAGTLQRIAENGAKGFYAGETASRLAGAMAANGGLIAAEDLAAYKTIDRQPLTGTYRGYGIVTAPPPSAGGVGVLQILGMLTGTHYDSDGPDSVKAVHYEAEAMRRFYADRSEYLGDPDFYVVPVKPLLDPAYLAHRRKTIDPDRATPSGLVEPGLPKTLNAGVDWKESKQTTHYNVVDAKGNAVAVTYTLNNSYGNGITVPGLGFLLNDEMDDFSAKPGAPNMFGLLGSDANAIEPGKRPLSSMTPTIITRNGKFFMAVGAPGGSRITTGVTEVILDVLDFHMNPQAAVDLPRFHHQWRPDILYLQNGFSEQTAAALKAMGYEVEATGGVARVEAIVMNNGTLEGGTESRLSGKAAGY